MFAWLKNYMPRSLYGRAALILLLPVIGVQFVVSVVFIQRHFEDVTELMTASVARELSVLHDGLTGPDAETARALAQQLQITVDTTGAEPVTNRRAFYDLSGRVVQRVLMDRLPQITAIDLCASRPRCAEDTVFVSLPGPDGALIYSFDRERVSASNPHQLLVIMAVLGAIMTVISIIFLRNQLRPIKRLARAAVEYGRGRVLPYRVGGATEVRAAGRAFLIMRDRIERQSRSRRMMLSGLSHDLRTPLTRMRLQLSLMEPGEDTDLLTRDVDDLQRFLDAFLDFSRGNEGDLVEVCAPGDLLREAVDAAARTGQVELGRVDDVAAMALRPMAIRRALDNLLTNALRHGSRAVAHLERDAKAIRLIVDDDGPGIPADERDQARRPFVQLDPSRNQDKGPGVGLGLAIVDDIARSHGGELLLGDSPLGGLRAVLDLPLADLDLTEADGRPGRT